MLKVGVAVLAAGIAFALPAGAVVRASPERAGFALLSDGRLVRIGLTTGAIRIRDLGTPPRTIQSGPLLGVAPGGRALYALVGSRIAVVDPTTLAVRRRIQLARGLRYRGLALGPTTGRLYVSGNRAVRVLDRTTGLATEDATLTIVDPTNGSVVSRPTARAAAGRSWYVYWISVTPDERVVALSYHGGCEARFDTCTTGADLLELDGRALRPCAPREPQDAATACSSSVHGAAVPYRDGFIAASGGAPLLQIDRGGSVVRRFQTGMATHVMDVAVDSSAGIAYAVGPCEKRGGLRAIHVDTGDRRRLRTAIGPRALCGSRVAVASPASLVVATGRALALAPRIPNAVLVVHSRTGRTLRRVRVGARVADVVAG